MPSYDDLGFHGSEVPLSKTEISSCHDKYLNILESCEAYETADLNKGVMAENKVFQPSTSCRGLGLISRQNE